MVDERQGCGPESRPHPQRWPQQCVEAHPTHHKSFRSHSLQLPHYNENFIFEVVLN